MKPIIILPPKAMSDENIKLLRENEICVVVAEDPAAVKFIDPIPSMSSRTQVESAAIGLSRILLNGQWGDYSSLNQIGRETFSRIYVDLLIKGSPLDKNHQTQAELEKKVFDAEKIDALRKLAQEEARAERVAAKEQKGTK